MKSPQTGNKPIIYVWILRKLAHRQWQKRKYQLHAVCLLFYEIYSDSCTCIYLLVYLNVNAGL